MKSTDKELKKAAVELNDLLEPKPAFNPKASSAEIVKWITSAAKLLEPTDEISAKTQAVLDDILPKKADSKKKGKKVEEEEEEEEAPTPKKGKGKKAPEPEPEPEEEEVDDDDAEEEVDDDDAEEEDDDDAEEEDDDDAEEEEEEEEEEEKPAPKKGKGKKAPVEEEDDDDDDEEEEEKPAKKGKDKGKKEAPAKEKKEKKAKGEKFKGPGIITSIVTILEESGKEGISIADIHKKLIKMFPDRDEKSMLSTIKVQVPGRINKEKWPVQKLENGNFRKAVEKKKKA